VLDLLCEESKVAPGQIQIDPRKISKVFEEVD
jgi:hypothetical protein